jgi:hypothetical protein
MPRLARDGNRRLTSHASRFTPEIASPRPGAQARRGSRRKAALTADRLTPVETPTLDVSQLRGPAGEIGNAPSQKEAAVVALLHESAQAAQQAVPRLSASAAQIALRFERNELDAAHRDLATFVGALRTLATICSVLVSVGKGSGHRARLEQLAAQLSAALDAVIAHQTNRAWMEVARTLSVDLAPLLGGWSSLLLAIDAEIAAAGELVHGADADGATPGGADR